MLLGAKSSLKMPANALSVCLFSLRARSFAAPGKSGCAQDDAFSEEAKK